MSMFNKVTGQKKAPDFTMQDVQNDPVGIAQKVGYNIPQNLAVNPQAMVQHLLQSGQISPLQLQQAMQRARGMGGWF